MSEVRPIDANALNAKFEELKNQPQNTLKDIFFLDVAMTVVDSAPTLDYTSVKHGEWEWDMLDVYMCSTCGEKSHVKEVLEKPAWDYCPNCGAKMDGDGK